MRIVGFEALAATDTLRDNGVSEREMLADTRRVWAPFDVSGWGKPRLSAGAWCRLWRGGRAVTGPPP